MGLFYYFLSLYEFKLTLSELTNREILTSFIEKSDWYNTSQNYKLKLKIPRHKTWGEAALIQPD